MRRITVNLAPAGLRKEGSGFDLPIALSILAASGQLPRDRLRGHAAVGELGLDGRLRPVGGVLAVAEAARRAGFERLAVRGPVGGRGLAGRHRAGPGSPSRRGGRVRSWRGGSRAVRL